jgi:hypothetical protein
MYPLSRVRPRSDSGALLFCGRQEPKKTADGFLQWLSFSVTNSGSLHAACYGPGVCGVLSGRGVLSELVLDLLVPDTRYTL